MSLDAPYNENDQRGFDSDLNLNISKPSDTSLKKSSSKHRNALLDIEIINEQRALRVLLDDELYLPNSDD